MHVQYIPLSKIKGQMQLSDILSTEFLSLMVLLASTLLFTVSTESRQLLLEEELLGSRHQFKIKSIFEQNAMARIKRDKRFLFSKMVHQKAI